MPPKTPKNNNKKNKSQNSHSSSSSDEASSAGLNTRSKKDNRKAAKKQKIDDTKPMDEDTSASPSQNLGDLTSKEALEFASSSSAQKTISSSPPNSVAE